jgi:lipopolysaccharide export system protein LptA
MRIPLLPALALALALALTAPAHAQRDDKSQPVNFTADSGEVNYQTKVGNLAGNVVITQGTMSIRADRITFRQNSDNSISATAHGNPIAFRQKREGTDEYFEGFAQRAEYDGEKELLELFDRALLKRGQDEIRSNYISYNTRSEQFRAEGRPDAAGTPTNAGPGARVRGTFQPRSEDGKGTADAAKAPAAKPAPLPLRRSGELPSKAAK